MVKSLKLMLGLGLVVAALTLAAPAGAGASRGGRCSNYVGGSAAWKGCMDQCRQEEARAAREKFDEAKRNTGRFVREKTERAREAFQSWSSGWKKGRR
ncbi:MAG: hypothetical protein AB1641_30880 [Thermodesulfobacteriota bacterium]